MTQPARQTVTLGITDFVRRQTPESKHSHFDGTWDELLEIVHAQWHRAEVSPHNTEVRLVPVPPELSHRFYTALVEVTPDTPLRARFEPRVPGEDPFIQVEAVGFPKAPARKAEIILYSHEVLARDGDAPPTREADFYVVSVNTYATDEPEPMSPMTMARNFLGLKGGTRPETPYTAEEFARAIVYWSRRVRTVPRRPDGAIPSSP